MEPQPIVIAKDVAPSAGPDRPGGWVWPLAVGLAALAGLWLLADSLLRSSATYDEVAYLRIAAEWWRTGRQEAITRMGSPLTFWKIQQVPVLWALDRVGFGAVVDDPVGHQRVLLPLVRTWSLSIWLAALLVTAAWSRRLYGPRAMALAAGLFALSPNLLAHGALVTMELPLVACTTAMFLLFWRFLQTGRPGPLTACAAVGGLALSCKATTALVPPILGLVWWLDLVRTGACGPVRAGVRVTRGMLGFLAVLLLANLLVTGFATLPMSARVGQAHPTLAGTGPLGPELARLARRLVEAPIPQDWVGFLIQARHQRSGGPSYLLGHRRLGGWWYYYFVALAVKVPLSVWLLVAGRAWLGRRVRSAGRDAMLPLAITVFLIVVALGSTRNYGIRYLLPLAPLAIVWVSALAEGGKLARGVAVVGLVGQAVAVALVHPHELSYFNVVAGGPGGGRRFLADSNLDWGQGARALARLQARRPELRDLTFYYFGDTDPGHYGVVGRRYVIDAGADHPGLPPALTAETGYLAVSRSLQWGPWGPPGYFRVLDRLAPVRVLDDQTIAIYRASDLAALRRTVSRAIPATRE